MNATSRLLAPRPQRAKQDLRKRLPRPLTYIAHGASGAIALGHNYAQECALTLIVTIGLNVAGALPLRS